LLRILCSNCDADISDCSDRFCPTCGQDIGFPNVRDANRKEEREALEARYKKAVDDSKANHSHPSLENFEKIAQTSSAVININIDHLHRFLTYDNELYSTYDLQVSGQTRKSAKTQDDRDRRTVEAMLFGGYGQEIRYAALSLDGIGLKSYGACAVKLRDIAIAKRATVLEKNSYHFLEEHGIKFKDPIPPGYKAIWQERHKVAVAKLAAEISSSTSPDDYPKILLFSEGNRQTDRFIEVHIFGAFDNNAIESVLGKTPAKNKPESAWIAGIKDYLAVVGKDWIEE